MKFDGDPTKHFSVKGGTTVRCLSSFVEFFTCAWCDILLLPPPPPAAYSAPRCALFLKILDIFQFDSVYVGISGRVFTLSTLS